MTLQELGDKMDIVEFEGWANFFGVRYPGGARGPEDEINDVFHARMLCLETGERSVRKWMLYPPPVTEKEHKKAIETAAAKLKLMAGYDALKKKKAQAKAKQQVPKPKKRRSNG